MSVHPIIAQLELLAAGELDDAEATRTRTHLASCEDCRQRFEECVANRSIAGEIRDAMTGGKTSASPREPRTSPGTPAGDAPAAPDPFPGYEILGEIHRGGQGVVYEAIQKGTKRRVAIKVMREGPFAGPRDMVRFEREVEILGQLNHPNIVTIHASGTAAGCFYYVMDYIAGRSLEAWMTAGGQSIRQTLRLFARICEAINAAHLQGVLHRDLKPSNILIDAKDEPHILDFGLAKVVAGDAADDHGMVMTITGQFLGSLPWASPEQVEGVPGTIDVRTDVYSLGVLLYRALAGRFPYDVVGTMRNIMERILNAQPARPSTYRREIDDEIDTIVLKCLAKERERRYQTAGELGGDIRRYLAGEPIEAKRDSGLYVLKKTLRRYRVPAAVAAGIFVVIVLALAVSATSWRRAARDRDAARQAESLAVQRGHEAEQARRLAEDERRRADERADWARRMLYANQIAAVERAHSADAGQMKALLDQCATDLRGWEWYRLRWLSDRSRQTLTGHDGAVSGVAWDRDGTRIASGSHDKTVRVWDAATGREILTLRGHTNSVRAVAFSPDGKHIASSSDDKTARIWDAATGREVLAFRGHASRIPAVCFSPDGTRVASASADRTLRVWDSATGEEKLVLRGHTNSVWCAAFSPNGRQIASGGADATLRLWDVESGAVLRTFRGHERAVWTVAFSPDGARLASGSIDATVRLWNTNEDDEPRTLRGHGGAVATVAFSPNGKHVASAGWDARLKIWDTSRGAEVLTLCGHEDLVWAVAFSPDGQHLASGAKDKTLRIWDVAATTQEVVAQKPGDDDPGEPVGTESEDAAGSAGGRTTKKRDGPASAAAPAASQRAGTYDCIAISPSAELVAAATVEESIEIRSVATGETTLKWASDRSRLTVIAFSPEEKKAAFGHTDGEVRIWDIAANKELLRTTAHQGRISALAFSPDGKRIASTGADKVVHVWDASTGAAGLSLRSHEAAVYAVALSPDGRRIASGDRNGVLILWDAATGRELAVLKGDTAPIVAIAFSPDGTLVAAGNDGKKSRLWDTTTGRERFSLCGHASTVFAIVFSPDGRRLVSGGTDNKLKIWDAVTGEPLLTLYGHSRPILGAAFSRDGRRLVSVSTDRVIRIWHTRGQPEGSDEPQTATSRLP